MLYYNFKIKKTTKQKKPTNEFNFQGFVTNNRDPSSVNVICINDEKVMDEQYTKFKKDTNRTLEQNMFINLFNNIYK